VRITCIDWATLVALVAVAMAIGNALLAVLVARWLASRTRERIDAAASVLEQKLIEINTRLDHDSISGLARLARQVGDSTRAMDVASNELDKTGRLILELRTDITNPTPTDRAPHG
jgi:alcohol dehydrogenase class IV